MRKLLSMILLLGVVTTDLLGQQQTPSYSANAVLNQYIATHAASNPAWQRDIQIEQGNIQDVQRRVRPPRQVGVSPIAGVFSFRPVTWNELRKEDKLQLLQNPQLLSWVTWYKQQNNMSVPAQIGTPVKPAVNPIPQVNLKPLPIQAQQTTQAFISGTNIQHPQPMPTMRAAPMPQAVYPQNPTIYAQTQPTQLPIPQPVQQVDYAQNYRQGTAYNQGVHAQPMPQVAYPQNPVVYAKPQVAPMPTYCPNMQYAASNQYQYGASSQAPAPVYTAQANILPQAPTCPTFTSPVRIATPPIPTYQPQAQVYAPPPPPTPQQYVNAYTIAEQQAAAEIQQMREQILQSSDTNMPGHSQVNSTNLPTYQDKTQNMGKFNITPTKGELYSPDPLYYNLKPGR